MNLYHHGIKGQKWGVRRYQNEDGSLTEAGKRRYRYQLYQNKDGTLNERGVKNYINQKGQLTKRGIKVYEEIGRRTVNDRTDKLLMEKGLRSLNGDDYLKKGTVVGRIAGADDVIDDKRKYVYLTDGDRDEYIGFAYDGMLGAKGDLTEFEYKLKKDIKIANAKTVLDHMLDKYGDTLVKDLSDFDDYTEEDLKENHYKFDEKTRVKDIVGQEYPYYDKVYKVLYNTHDKPYETWAEHRLRAGMGLTSQFMRDRFFKNAKISGEVVKHFRDKGYDAMVDLEDYRVLTEYPMIMLNPADSLKKYRQEDLY